MPSIGSTSRAAVLEGPKALRLRTLPLPEIGPDDALLRIEMAGICGTDVKYYAGTLPLPYPVILGHEILGSIAAIGNRAAARYQATEGDRVLVEGSVPCWTCGRCRSGEYRFCQRKRVYGSRTPITDAPGLWGGLSEYMYLAPGSILHSVSAEVAPQTAISAALLANGIEWLVHRGGASIGDCVVIQGSGPQGLAATVVAAETGARQIIVTGLARDTSRLALARDLGAHHTIVADEADVVSEISHLTDGRLADVVLDVTGSPTGVATSVEVVRTLGTVVVAGLAGKDVIAPFQIDRLVWNEVRLQGVYVKGEAAYAKALELIDRAGDRYPIERIVSHLFPLDQAEDAIVAAGSVGDGFVKAAVIP
jgi:alcohol dehydrogenase